MIKRNLCLAAYALLLPFGMSAQEMSLAQCREMAIEHNKRLQISAVNEDIAALNRKEARTRYLPQLNAAGTYTRSGDEVSILSTHQRRELRSLGTSVAQAASNLSAYAPALNQVGNKIADAFRTDTRDLTAATLMLVQPVYMGGQIRAYNNITRYAQDIAHLHHDQELQEVILDVDETYWKLVQLQSKKTLALGYLRLTQKLNSDVNDMIRQGMATKSDGLSIGVKVNEAKVTVIQVNNGISLLKMKLGQLCGVDDYDRIQVADSVMEAPNIALTDTAKAMRTAMQLRPELKQLEAATHIFDQKVKIAQALYLPHIALQGGYLLSNPSTYNSFQNKFRGNWNVGVSVTMNIPAWGQRKYKVRAAKDEARISRIELDDARDKIRLQVRQCSQRLQEARETLVTATKSLEEADENLRTANYGYHEGVIPLSNVIEAQTAWLSAHSTFLNSQADVKIAEAYLQKSIGSLYD